MTCPNTFSPSYSYIATREVGAVAALAKDRRNAEHECLNSAQNFTPVVIESSGVVGPQLGFSKRPGSLFSSFYWR